MRLNVVYKHNSLIESKTFTAVYILRISQRRFFFVCDLVCLQHMLEALFKRLDCENNYVTYRLKTDKNLHQIKE